MRRTVIWGCVAAWLFGALVVWNVVFDAHIVAGARDYRDRQQAFIEGRGPQQDMERSMAVARTAGSRAATAWASAVLVPGLVVAAWRFRRNPTPSTPDPSSAT
jgi:hypothetical protein